MSEKKKTRRSRGSDLQAREQTRSPGAEDWALAEKVLLCPEVRIIYIWGPPGTGKTRAALHVGVEPSETYALTLTQDAAVSDLRGMFLPKGNEFTWESGPATVALQSGRRLVLNEPSLASPEVLSFLYGLLDSPETARITLPDRSTVTPAPGWECVLCDNAPPDDLPEALRDRFEAVLEIREPHPDALASLSPELRDAALRSFDLEPERRVSLRAWITLEKLRPIFGLRDACLAVFGAARGTLILDALTMAGVS